MQTKILAFTASASALAIGLQPGRDTGSTGLFLSSRQVAQQAANPDADNICRFGPYLILFEKGASDLTPEAEDVLDDAASGFANCGRPAIVLAGHADRSGSANFNLSLSRSRVATVAKHLRERGIPAEKIASTWFGEERPRVPTADGEPNMANRRVEIMSRADAAIQSPNR